MNFLQTADRNRESASDYDSVSQGLFDIARIMDDEKRDAPEERLGNIVRIAEKSTVDLRGITARAMRERADWFIEGSANMLGISVKEETKWICITIPGILPHRRRIDRTDFLTLPLRNSLIRFQRNTPIERFGDCAICIVHGYDVALSVHRIRDYDNVETKRYLDVIESVFLTNDSGLTCSVLQTTELMDRDCTQFYLMQPETLAFWAKTFIKTKPDRSEKA